MTAQLEAEEESKRKRPFVLIVLLLLLTLWTLHSSFGEEGRPAERNRENRIELWVKEVLDAATTLDCGASSPLSQGPELEVIEEALPSWEEEARLSASQNLVMLQKVEWALRCQVPTGASRGPREQALTGARQRLRDRIERLMRSHQARLRRAERFNDAPAQLLELNALRELLSAHDGPLTAMLLREIRRREPDGV